MRSLIIGISIIEFAYNNSINQSTGKKKKKKKNPFEVSNGLLKSSKWVIMLLWLAFIMSTTIEISSRNFILAHLAHSLSFKGLHLMHICLIFHHT